MLFYVFNIWVKIKKEINKEFILNSHYLLKKDTQDNKYYKFLVWIFFINNRNSVYSFIKFFNIYTMLIVFNIVLVKIIIFCTKKLWPFTAIKIPLLLIIYYRKLVLSFSRQMYFLLLISCKE